MFVFFFKIKIVRYLHKDNEQYSFLLTLEKKKKAKIGSKQTSTFQIGQELETTEPEDSKQGIILLYGVIRKIVKKT